MTACANPNPPVEAGPPPAGFESVVDGRQTGLFILANRHGVEIRVTNHGARIVSWLAPDRDGNLADIVLGYDNLPDYLASPEPYFGAAIGRCANRIARGRFTLDGVECTIPPNNGPHALHGGPKGFHAVVWDARQPDPRTLELALLSPDGDQGFPGNLRVKMVYALTDDNELKITYEAVTDRPTIVNLTNHSFFNLHGAGSGGIGGHLLEICAGHCTPADAAHIPTGEIAPVAGTPFDFRRPAPIGGRKGLNFVLDRPAGPDLASGRALPLAARAIGPETGRVLEVRTDQPGLQLYCSDSLPAGITGKQGKPYGRRSALCLETQRFPDSPNRAHFPSATLRPGETYRHVCVYKTAVE